MSQSLRLYVLVCAVLMAAGALLHLAVMQGGAEWYALVGAPRGLIAMLSQGSLRPAVSCVVIASALFVCSAYALSALGHLRRLPALRVVLALIAIGLVGRGLILPALAAWHPRTLLGICGRCEQLNAFVLLSSALCLFLGGGYSVAAMRATPSPLPAAR